MPVRNTVRIESPNTYFHVYNRGVERRRIFLESSDYAYFIALLARYLSSEPQKDVRQNIYPYYREFVDLNAYCLMPNHIHLLLYQKEDPFVVGKLMASVMIAYTMYFNKKYKRRGPLFETRYKASPIFAESYLQHISRYIHLNPKGYKGWRFSSYTAYLEAATAPDWLYPDPILKLFDSPEQYCNFVNDYESMQRELEALKHSLADY